MESVGQHILWVYWQLCPPGFKWFHCQVWGAQGQNTPKKLKSAPPELLISFPEAFSTQTDVGTTLEMIYLDETHDFYRMAPEQAGIQPAVSDFIHKESKTSQVTHWKSHK